MVEERGDWLMDLMRMVMWISLAAIGGLPRGPEVVVTLPDTIAELRAFRAEPPEWNKDIVNSASGDRDGWFKEHWLLVDYTDRSQPLGNFRWLKNRGIRFDGQYNDEYQESLHFSEEGALALFRENGIARSYENGLVMTGGYHIGSKEWTDRAGMRNAYYMNPNAPRWGALLQYGWVSAALLGEGVSQDNISSVAHRFRGSAVFPPADLDPHQANLAQVMFAARKKGGDYYARYDDWNNLRFFHFLRSTDRLPEFRARYTHIRDYIRDQPELRSLLLPECPINGPTKKKLAICHDPVMAQYALFLNIAPAHNVARAYRDCKLAAARLGRTYDLHGNQGSWLPGIAPYASIVAQFVDGTWYEGADGTYWEMFERNFANAFGPFCIQLADAEGGYRKPMLGHMQDAESKRPDVLEHALAEQCAGGSIPLIHPGNKPTPLNEIKHGYLQFRQDHRALFERTGRTRYAQVAILYSLPTFIYANYNVCFEAAPTADLSGAARALEEGHIPYEVVIGHHPDIRPDDLTLERLRQFRVVILPSVWNLSAAHVEVLERYLAGGGAVAVLGRLGTRDEYNAAREQDVLTRLRSSGRVEVLLDGASFGSARSVVSEATKRQWRSVVAAVRGCLGKSPILDGDLPEQLWIKTWKHEDGFVAAHVLNYNFTQGMKPTPAPPVAVHLAVPQDVPVEEVRWLVPREASRVLPFEKTERGCKVTLPVVRVYGVLVVGRRGAEAAVSPLRQGNRFLERARYACDGQWGDLMGQAASVTLLQRRARTSPETAAAYAARAEALLRAVAAQQERAIIRQMRDAGNVQGAVAAFDFGGKDSQAPWRAVEPDTAYRPETGFGWLPPLDGSRFSPEECYYPPEFPRPEQVDAIRPGGGTNWPYAPPLAPALATKLHSGRRHRFRIDVAEGTYRVRVVSGALDWGRPNYYTCSMVTANGAPTLLDEPAEAGELRSRSFVTRTRDGGIELTFGGPLGWVIAAVVVEKTSTQVRDPLVQGAIRQWRVSPRYSNPAWWPIDMVHAEPERDLARLDTDGWTAIAVPAGGLPVVNLGDNTETEIGDVIYAEAVVERPRAGTVQLSLGASSAAEVWVNGEKVAYVPNQRGLLRDEAVVAVPLRQGSNRVMVKLARFWERHWLFYAAVLSPGS